MNCNVHAKAEIHPTEDLDKVITALSNIFDYDEIEIGEDFVCISGGVESLNNLKESLEKRRIRDTARIIIMKGSRDNLIFFSLSKQAALVGIPNFVEGELSPLGEIEVTIKTDDLARFINWITPTNKTDI